MAARNGTRLAVRAFPSGFGVYSRPMARLSLAAALSTLLCAACAATTSEMHRAEQAYEQARFDAARVWLVDLERRAAAMSPSMRARYFYLRGMTEYRLGRRLEALHYLEVAKEIAGDDERMLQSEQRELLARTLAELEPREPLSYRPPPAPDASR